MAIEGGSVGAPINVAPFGSGMLAVGTPGSAATFTSNGSDLYVNTGVANSNVTLRPNGEGSAAGQVSATTQGFLMQAGAIFAPNTYAALPACSGATAGYTRWVTDSPPVGYNAVLTAGGGTTHVLAFCNGSGWTAR